MAAPRNQRVEVLRAFRYNGKTVGAGSVLDVPLPFAIEMRTAHRVKFVASDTKAQQNENPTPPTDATPKGEEEAKPKGKAA